MTPSRKKFCPVADLFGQIEGALTDRRNAAGRVFCGPMPQVYEQLGLTTCLMHLDRDLELDFIREFAVGGELLKGSSVDDRRERIRVAIYARNLLHQPFRDSGMMAFSGAGRD
jgi:hypothetical protein